MYHYSVCCLVYAHMSSMHGQIHIFFMQCLEGVSGPPKNVIWVYFSGHNWACAYDVHGCMLCFCICCAYVVHMVRKCCAMSRMSLMSDVGVPFGAHLGSLYDHFSRWCSYSTYSLPTWESSESLSSIARSTRTPFGPVWILGNWFGNDMMSYRRQNEWISDRTSCRFIKFWNYKWPPTGNDARPLPQMLLARGPTMNQNPIADDVRLPSDR